MDNLKTGILLGAENSMKVMRTSKDTFYFHKLLQKQIMLFLKEIFCFNDFI